MSNAQTQTAAPLVTQPPPEVVQAEQLANRQFAAAQQLVVDSPEGYEAAAGDLVDLRERWKAIEKQRVYLKEPFLEGGRRIDAFFKVPLDRLAEAAEVVKSHMLVFKQAEDARVQAEREKREAEERAERERLEAIQREAEQRQREAEEAAKAEEAAARKREADALAEQERIAAAARKAGDEAAAKAADEAAAKAREEAEAEVAASKAKAAAVAAEAAQASEAAQAELEIAEVAPPVPVVASRAVASGVAARKTWKVKSVDKRALVIAAGKAAEAGDETLLAYLDVNETALNGVARALKAAARVAGVVFAEVSSLASTGRR
jgi:hypothetical protein